MSNLPMKLVTSAVLALTCAMPGARSAPLDSPDVIYVNGQPCGSFCQAYLGINPRGRRNQQEVVKPPTVSPEMRQGRQVRSQPDRSKQSDRRLGIKAASIPPAKVPDKRKAVSSAALDGARLRPDEARQNARTTREQHGGQATESALPAPSVPSVAGSGPDALDGQASAQAAKKDEPRLDGGVEERGGSTPPRDSASNDPATQQPIPPADGASGVAEPLSGGPAPSSPAFSPQLPANNEAVTAQQPQATASVPPTSNDPRKTDGPIGSERADDSSTVGVAPPSSPQERLSEEQVAVVRPQSALTIPRSQVPPPSATIEGRVAVIMVRTDIMSISDLSRKDIAIDVRQAPSRDIVKSALAAAGAGGANLTDGKTKALDRLLSGEVPAAVLAVLSASAAENFPNIAGFRLFRIPLAAN
jgi:hypothetical protein